MLNLLHGSPGLFTGIAAVLGLVIGSFLNVVIYRLPLILERGWKEQCRELMQGGNSTAEAAQARFNLLRPSSHCPHCGHTLRFYENIPLISYIFLRGRCSACNARISPRYPLIEVITAVSSAAVAWHFGYGWETMAALIFTWSLISLSAIDIDYQILPDAITLPMLWMGLTLSLFPVFADTRSSITGAIAGYLSLWAVYQVFRLLTGKEGMGYGDFKLLAMLGAWMGWKALPIIILMSSVVGAISGIILIFLRGRHRSQTIPFGPYLAAAGWITLLWGEDIASAYLQWSGIT
jgi:leader peptidase (prepilin peptidase)/N-methyltransferase